MNSRGIVAVVEAIKGVPWRVAAIMSRAGECRFYIPLVFVILIIFLSCHFSVWEQHPFGNRQGVPVGRACRQRLLRVKSLISIILLTLFFPHCIILPAHKVSFRSQLPGALFAVRSVGLFFLIFMASILRIIRIILMSWEPCRNRAFVLWMYFCLTLI